MSYDRKGKRRSRHHHTAPETSSSGGEDVPQDSYIVEDENGNRYLVKNPSALQAPAPGKGAANTPAMTVAPKNPSDILQALGNTGNPADVELLCQAVTFSTEDDPAAGPYFAENGAAALLANALVEFRDEVGVQDTACSAVAALAKSQTGFAQKFKEANGIPAITTALTNHLDDVGTQDAACGAMAALGLNNEPIVRAFIRNGGVKGAVKAMDTYRDNYYIQENASNALWFFAEASESFDLVATGAAQSLIAALVLHKARENVCEAAVGALNALDPAKGTNMDELCELGLVTAITNTLVQWAPSSRLIAEMCFSVLHIVAKACPQHLRQRDGVPDFEALVVRCILYGMTQSEVIMSEEVQLAATGVLSTMAHENDDSKAILTAQGTIPVLLATLSNLPNNVHVVMRCSRALSRIVKDVNAQKEFIECGGLDTLLETMKANLDKIYLQDTACTLLGRLAQTQRKIIVSTDAIDLLRAAVLNHPDTIVADSGRIALKNLKIDISDLGADTSWTPAELAARGGVASVVSVSRAAKDAKARGDEGSNDDDDDEDGGQEDAGTRTIRTSSSRRRNSSPSSASLSITTEDEDSGDNRGREGRRGGGGGSVRAAASNAKGKSAASSAAAVAVLSDSHSSGSYDSDSELSYSLSN